MITCAQLIPGYSYSPAVEVRYFDGGNFVLGQYAEPIAEAIIETLSHGRTT